jgi:tol-pal system protein YbgF
VQDRTEPEPVAPYAIQAPVTGDPAQEQAEYQKALSLLKQGNYPDAIAAFGAFLDKYPAGNYADNAQYWLGEASYVMRDFDAALRDFDQVLERHPTSTKVPGAMLKMGYIHYEKGDWAKARKVLGELVAQYPNSTESRLAQNRLERMRKEGR